MPNDYIGQPGSDLLMVDLDQRYQGAGHLIGAGGVPTVAAGAQAASASLVSGKDDAGRVTATALASGMAAGALATITFGSAYAAAPNDIQISDTSAVANSLYVSARSATSFTVSSRSAATASQVITFDFAVIA
jgi:hypothetical protein